MNAFDVPRGPNPDAREQAPCEVCHAPGLIYVFDELLEISAPVCQECRPSAYLASLLLGLRPEPGLLPGDEDFA